MKTKNIIFIIVLCAALNLNAGSPASYKVTLSGEYRHPSKIILNFHLGDYEISHRFVNGKMCDLIELKDSAVPLEKGVPSLPFVVRSIIIPADAKMALEVTGVKFNEVKVKTIVPSRGAIRLNRDPEEIPFEFGEIYNQDKWFPENAARLGRPYILRDYRGAAVYFHPFAYNPVKGILRIAQSITITVKNAGVSTINSLPVKKPKKRKISQVFARIYKNHFINHGEIDHTYSYPSIPGVGNMIVITTDEFRPAVEPLVEWKNRKGIKTDLYIYPTDTGLTADAIKSFIQEKYDSQEGLAFILIVGDADDVPPGTGNVYEAKGETSDLVYTLLAGDDEYADAMIGRFSVATLTQAQTVVNKNLWYEMNPDPNGEWYHKAVGLAHEERYSTPYPREIMKEIGGMMLGYNYTEFTTIYDPESRKSHLFDAVNQGRGWINALYHGDKDGWMHKLGDWEYFFDNVDVQQLENAYMTPIVISCACYTGSFADPEVECFAETWQRLGTPEEPKGSIVFLGASSILRGNAWIALKEINYHLVNENYFTAGGLIFNGVMKMVEVFSLEPDFIGQVTFQLWHLFGDPSLFIYSDTPKEMEIAYDDRLLSGAASFTVHVSRQGGPVKNALAALYMNNKLYGSAYTDEAGTAVVPINGSLPGNGTMEVNVTAYNKMPYFGTVKIKASRKGKRLKHRQ